MIELVVSLAVVTAIMAAIGSTMLIAGKAMPQADSPARASIAGSEALERMASELQYAVAVNQRSPHMIEFVVADRNGDGNSEVIRYEWSGTVGDPLIRTYNSGAPVNVLSDVGEFDLQYELETVTTEVSQGNESTETLLTHYGILWSLRDYAIENDETYGQYFRPALPADAVSWEITQVYFFVKRAGPSDGETKVQIQGATAGGLPSGIVLEQKTLLESGLPTWYVLYGMTFTEVSGLSPQQGVCLTFKWQSGSRACEIMGRQAGVTAPDVSLIRSTNAGVSWASLPGQSLLFWVYGTVTTAGVPVIEHTYHLGAVGVRLRVGADNQATLQTQVRIVNRPEATP